MATAATPPGKVNYYELLGIGRNASDQEIKQAYRQSARRVHPDRQTNTASEEWMKEVNKAYEILSDQERRADYDRQSLERTSSNGIWTGEFLLNAARCSEEFRSLLKRLQRQKVTHQFGLFPAATNAKLHEFFSGPFKQLTTSYAHHPTPQPTTSHAKCELEQSGRYDMLLESIAQVVNDPALCKRASYMHDTLVHTLHRAHTTTSKHKLSKLSPGTRVPIVDLSVLTGPDLRFLLDVFAGDQGSDSGSSRKPGNDQLLERLLEFVPHVHVQQLSNTHEAKPLTNCGTCHQRFGRLQRPKYTCFVCSNLQCSSCTIHIAKIPRFGQMTPQKVCKTCTTELSSKDGEAWMEGVSRFLQKGAVPNALGCFLLALACCSESALQYSKRLARELIRCSIPELALPLIVSQLSQAKSIPSEALRLQLLAGSALKSMADDPDLSWNDKWVFLIGSKCACLEASLEHSSLDNFTDVPELSAKTAELDSALNCIEQQQETRASRLVNDTVSTLDQAWKLRDWAKLLKTVRATRDNNLLVVTNGMDPIMEALQQFIGTKEGFLTKMLPEDRFALMFLRGILNAHHRHYKEGVTDLEAVAWSGFHPSWAQTAGIDILLGLEAERLTHVLPHHDLMVACTDLAKSSPGSFKAALAKLNPPFLPLSSETLQPPSKLHWPHLCVQGLNLVAHSKYEEAIDRQVQKGKWSNEDAGFAYIDLIPACEHPAEIAVCFLTASLWFLKEVKAKVTGTRVMFSEVHALKTLALIYVKQALAIAELSLHPGMRMYVSRLGFAVVLQITQYTGKLSTPEDSELLVQLLSTLVYSCRFCPFWNFPMVRVSEAVLLNIISGRHHNEFVLGLQNVPPEQSPVHRYELCYQLYENDLRFVRPLRDPTSARNRAMQEMLREKNWTFEDVSSLMSSPLSPRTSEGWLKPQSVLGIPMEYAEVTGFTLDFDSNSPSVQLLAVPATRKVGLFSRSDVDTVLQLNSEDLFPIFFSLDPPSQSEHFHPFQQCRYEPQSLQGTALLQTLLETDYLLKCFSIGVDVSAKPPFNMRPCNEGLTQHLQPELREVLKPVMDRGYSRHRMHRFWIQADELVYNVVQNGSKVTYHVGQVKMVVRSHPLLLGPDGNLLDTPDDDDPNSPEVKFAEDLTNNYDLISQYFPMFARLRELCKLQFLGLIIDSQLKNLEETAQGKGVNIPDHMLRSIQQQELQQKKAALSRVLSDMKQQVGSWPSANDPSVISNARQMVERNLPSNVPVWQFRNEIEAKVILALRQNDANILSQVIDALMKVSQQRLSRSSLEDYVRHWLSGGSSFAEAQLVDFLSSALPLPTRQDILQATLTIAKQRYSSFRDMIHSLRSSAKRNVQASTRGKSSCTWVPAALRKKTSSVGTSLCYGGVLIAPKFRKGYVRPPSEQGSVAITLQARGLKDTPVKLQPTYLCHRVLTAISIPLDQASEIDKWNHIFQPTRVPMKSPACAELVQSFRNGKDNACSSAGPPRNFRSESSSRSVSAGTSSGILLKSTNQLRVKKREIEFRKLHGMAGPEYEASHTVSLDLIKHIVNTAGLSLDETELRTWANKLENFEKVPRKTNRSDHVIIDNALKKKAKPGGGTLSREEEDRATAQVQVILETMEDCPIDIRQPIKEFYQMLHTEDGSSVWEKARQNSDKATASQAPPQGTSK